MHATAPFDANPWIDAFAERCRASHEYQGHGWGAAWRTDGGWDRTRSIDPIWEPGRTPVPEASVVVVHARSAFRNEGIVVENNMPFLASDLAFAFNGELRGVRLSAPGETGAARLLHLLERFNAAAGGAPYVSDREGFRVRVPGLLTATAYSPSVDLIAGQTPVGEAIVTTTGDVVRLLTGRRVVSFSPDGARILTAVEEPGVIALGAGWPADVLDTRSGATLTHVQESDVRYGSGRWEDEVSLVVVTDDEGVGRLARVTSDGVSSLLAEPAATTETIVLQTMP